MSLIVGLDTNENVVVSCLLAWRSNSTRRGDTSMVFSTRLVLHSKTPSVDRDLKMKSNDFYSRQVVFIS